ncbi:hypothetical protein [Rhodococcus sp. 14-2496-1d]|uniref:hypothetical protein n=1 Tax=Rhodococcus sp. 14-2496-1d TaxID=2023146 RepID=UPI0015C61EEA|nr:hypothetical protein [Rhodococcus sp. 14-2496-1d]
MKDVTGAQPGDHFDAPEIAAHNVDVHSFRRYAGTSTGRESFTFMSLPDLAVDESE